MGTILRQLLPIIAMTAVLYLLLVIPQNKKKKEFSRMLNSLQVMDEIITNGGMLGKIVKITEESIILETGPDNIKIELDKSGIYGKINRTEKVSAEDNKEIEYKEIKE